MKNVLRVMAFVVICMVIAVSAPAAVGNTSTLKCNPHKDLIWLYDSLTTFDVQAKLSCGETVEVLDRVQEYVRIRTRNGVEGYVPDSAFADLPAYEIRKDSSHDVGYVAKTVQAKEIAKASAANSKFAVPEAGVASASSQKSPATAGTKTVAATRSSMLPNDGLAEMSPRATAAPAKVTAVVQPVRAETQPIATTPKASDSTSDADTKSTTSTVVFVPSPAAAAKDAAGVDETPGFKVSSESEDPACRSYFSAYGLTSSQLKWIAQNRKKVFPSVCPAPSVSKVNYVIIFTHDVGFFSVTMPNAVHNINGFSDFQPMTTVDNALVSGSDSDRAHKEYVWVFQYANGGFNPETFSPRTTVQFTKVETNSLGSKAGSKAVEDAFHFLESANR